MKKLMCAAALTVLMSCALLGPEMVETGGVVGRQLNRVAERHDVYVRADESIDDMQEATLLAESQAMRVMLTVQPEVEVGLLSQAAAPIMGRHDAYLRADETLDPFDMETYLATTAGLRRFFVEAQK